jgi:carbonic anhydrase
MRQTSVVLVGCFEIHRNNGRETPAMLRSVFDHVVPFCRMRLYSGLALTFIISAHSSLHANGNETNVDSALIAETEREALGDVLTREEQQALTPKAVLEELMAGNQRFVANDLTLRNHSKQVRAAYVGQFPKAVILSCLDSRVPVEDVFDRGIGDVFVARVAGNFVNEDILGSMEFACHVAGAKLILVVGHTHCGAVQAAIDNVELGNITPMLAKIRPAITRAAPFEGEHSSGNPAYVAHICRENVRLAVATIREQSEILAKMEAANEIEIVPAYYDLSTGQVSVLREVRND